MIFKKIRKIRIFYKFLLVLLAISALPLLIVGVRLIDINRISLQDVTLELQANQAARIADAIENHMDNLRDKIVFLIESQGQPPIDWTLSERLLRSMLASSEDLLTVSLVRESGRELTKVFAPALEGKVELEDRSASSAFADALETRQPSVSSLKWDRYQLPRIDIVYPFADDIYIFIEASLIKLQNLVEETTIGESGFAYVVDSEGKIIMHPDQQKSREKASAYKRPIVEAVLSGRLSGSIEFTDIESGKDIIGAYAPVSTFARLGWGAIIEQDYEEAYYSAIVMRRQALILLGIVIIAACLIGYLLAQNLTSPVLRLTKAARNIAGGSFEVGPVIKWLKKVKFRDELVELASTFTQMAKQLKRYTEMQADKMNAILFSIADGIIMTDYEGKIMLSNNRAKELLGLNVKETLQNRNIQDIIKRTEISDSLKEAREKKDHISREIDLTRDKKSPKHLRADTSIVSQAESRGELGTVTVIRDITLEKELEQMKDDFIHSITHDLRSPMTSIRGFLEFLMDGTAGEINDQQKEFLEIIDRSSKVLLNMISDILDVAKIESGTMPMDISETDLKELADEVIETISSQTKKEGVEIEVVAKNKIKKVNADKNLISRVLTNLISNALKFTSEGGKISVEMESREDRVYVAVQDTGAGMPPDMCKKIFNKFEQVKGSRGKRRGTGLGLTITKYIVESHGGKIWAESEEGKGSRFEFWIPCDPERNNEKGSPGLS